MIAAAFGDQVAHTYVAQIKTMLDAGINVSLEGEWAAVENLITRQDPQGKVWGPDQRVDRATALRVATINGAAYVLKKDRLGSIEVGKLADLVVLDGNPLDDLHNSNTVRYVMKNGRLYEGATLNQRWPDQRAAEGLYWQTDGAIPDRTTGRGN